MQVLMPTIVGGPGGTKAAGAHLDLLGLCPNDTVLKASIHNIFFKRWEWYWLSIVLPYPKLSFKKHVVPHALAASRSACACIHIWYVYIYIYIYLYIYVYTCVFGWVRMYIYIKICTRTWQARPRSCKQRTALFWAHQSSRILAHLDAECCVAESQMIRALLAIVRDNSRLLQRSSSLKKAK